MDIICFMRLLQNRNAGLRPGVQMLIFQTRRVGDRRSASQRDEFCRGLFMFPRSIRARNLMAALAGMATLLSGASAFAADSAAGASTNSTPSAFAPTVPDKTPPPSPAPEGMVWIPGGEFSMGSEASSESLCGLPGLTRDALPVHRVYVKGFWMDKSVSHDAAAQPLPPATETPEASVSRSQRSNEF